MEKLFKEVLAVDRFYARIDDRDDYRSAKAHCEKVQREVNDLDPQQKIELSNLIKKSLPEQEGIEIIKFFNI